jgi:hypothetical protein
MIPQSPKRQEDNSSAVNLTISVIFHIVALLAFFFFAAHEGLFGKKLEHIIEIRMVKEEKPPEPPRRKPSTPKAEHLKTAPPKMEPPKIEPLKTAAAPTAPPASEHIIAPPPAEMPSFDFGGGKAIDTSSDPVQIYKSFVEYIFHSRWNQPDNVATDSSYVTEVEVSVSPDGQVSNPVWKQNIGDKKWNDSIQQVIATVTQLDRLPPTNFPPRFTIIFNVRNSSGSPDSE